MHVQRGLRECHHVSEMLNPPKPYADDCSNKRDCNDKRKPYVQVPVSRARLEITSQSNPYKKDLKALDFSLIWKQWTDSYSLLNYSFRFNSSTSTKLLIFCVLLTNYEGERQEANISHGIHCKSHSQNHRMAGKDLWDHWAPPLAVTTFSSRSEHWVPHPVTMGMNTWTLPRMANPSREVENLQGWVSQEPGLPCWMWGQGFDQLINAASPQDRRSLIMQKTGHKLNSLCQN